MIKSLPIALSLGLMPVVLLAAPTPPITLNPAQETALHCSAVFAVVADEQVRSVAESLVLTPLTKRGREYFVITSARLMEATGMTRQDLTARARAHVGLVRAALVADSDRAAARRKQLTPCLPLLDAEVPERAKR